MGGVEAVWITPTCGKVHPSEIYSHDFVLPPDPLGLILHPLGPVLLTIKIEVILTLGAEGIVTTCKDEAPTYPWQPVGEYNFMAALAPTFTIGAKVTASVELPFIISVSIFMQVDFAKLSMVMSFTGRPARRLLPAFQ